MTKVPKNRLHFWLAGRSLRKSLKQEVGESFGQTYWKSANAPARPIRTRAVRIRIPHTKILVRGVLDPCGNPTPPLTSLLRSNHQSPPMAQVPRDAPSPRLSPKPLLESRSVSRVRSRGSESL